MRSASITILLLAGLLSSCGRYETGIDRSIIRGTLSLVPSTFSEEEGANAGLNDSTDLGQDLGFFGYRIFQVTGSCLAYGVDRLSGDPTGDVDYYLFSSQADGTTTLYFDFPDDADLIYDVTVFDLATLDDDGNPTAIAGGSTLDSGGAWSADVDLAADGSYAVGVAGLRNDNDAATDYTLTLWGFDPNGVQFLVGAYAEQDPFERTYPLGGTSVENFTWNEDTLAWEGDYEALYIRSLTTTYDSGDNRTDEVDEAIPTVWMHAGDYSSLNDGILAGVSYASTATEVQLSTDDATTDEHDNVDIAVDTTQPIQIGWQYSEVEPNDVEIDGSTLTLTGDLSGANALPLATGLGYVDQITGILTYTADDPLWETDNDTFALSVGSELSANLTLDWDDSSADIDMIVFDSSGNWLTYAGASSAKPEKVKLADSGIYLEPDQVVYLQVLGYAGTAGDKNWSLNIEYTSP